MAITPKNKASSSNQKDQSGGSLQRGGTKCHQPGEKTKTKKEVAKDKKTRTKYDWVKLKQEYFSSDFLDVAPFIQHKYGKDTAGSGQIGKMTTGWGDEKRKIQEQIKMDAFKKFKANIKGQWDDVMEKLEMAHVTGLENLANMILDQGKVTKRKRISNIIDPDTKNVIGSEVIDIDWLMPYLHHGDITNIIKHIKLEKGEPTEIMDTNGKSLAKAWLDDLKIQKGSKQKNDEANE